MEKYTLEEAHAKIMEIKKGMGYDEYKSRELQRAYERGYQQAVIDLSVN